MIIKKFPEFLDSVHNIKTSEIPLSLTARLKCQNCGLFCRAILCPPHLWLTYPQFKSYKSTREFLLSFSVAKIFVWKNNGTRSWKIDKEELNHIDFRIKKGKELKGTEMAQAKELTKLMRQFRKLYKKNNYEVFGFIPGHCDFCAGKCPNRDNPPCLKRGMPSLESVGIDVYKLLKKLGVKFEYPVINYLTQVTMLLIRRK